MPVGFVPFPEEAVEGTLVDRFESIVEFYPDHVAITDRDRTLTYRELNESANRLAWGILKQNGPQPERVGFIANQDIDSIISIWGILKSGSTYINLDPAFSAERLQSLIDSLGITLLVSTPSSIAKINNLHDRLRNIKFLNLDEVAARPSDNPKLPISQDLPPYMNWTSGTSGKTKVFARHSRGVLYKERVKTNSLGLLSTDRWSVANPLSYGVSHYGLFGALLNGGTVCLYDIPSQGLQGFAEWMESQQITILLTTPPVFRSTFNPIPAGRVFPSVRMVIFTGDTMISRDVEICNEHFVKDCVLANSLGLTETGIITVGFINREVKTDGTIPVGYPFDGVEIVLVDDAGSPVSPRQVGEMTVRSRYLSHYPIELLSLKTGKVDPGYSSKLQHTGDLGRYLKDGSLEYLGRKDSVVKIRGLRVETSEIEALLHQHPKVKQAAVIAMQSKTSNNTTLVAYVALVADKNAASKELRTFLSVKLPNYMIPSFFLFIENVPLNVNGKVDRTQLPEPNWYNPESDVAYFPPHNRVEWRLVRIWQEVLNLERVGVHHEFAALGGESIQALQIMERINAEWNIKLPLQSLLLHPTVANLARLINDLKTDAPKASIIAIREDGAFPATFMLPAGARTVMSTTRLASLLTPGRRIFALEYPGMEGYLQPLDRVEDLASFFVQEIRSVQAHGPYHLIGQCMGGIVILEMAQQLTAAGEKVGLLSPLDSNPPLPRHYFKDEASSLLRSGKIRTLLKKLFDRYSKLSLFNKSRSYRIKMDEGLKTVEQPEWLENPLDPTSQQVLEGLDDAKNRYFPRPYHGHALLILSETARETSKQKVWDVILPDKDLYYIPDTSHRTIFAGDRSLGQIAELINQNLPMD